MLRQARIGVIVVTWWGVHQFGLQSVELIMDEAAKADIKVCFHIAAIQIRGHVGRPVR